MRLLVAGGPSDPNISALIDKARGSGLDVVDGSVAAEATLSWNFSSNVLFFKGIPLDQVCGAFVRYDIFSYLEDRRPHVSQRALAWYTALEAWALASPKIALFNRSIDKRAGYKPAVLAAAKEIGFHIPDTEITNVVSPVRRESTDDFVAKPVCGGGYCETLEAALSKIDTSSPAPSPAIVQERLSYPELRVYVIGSKVFAFRISSSALDYRVNNEVDIQQCECPYELSTKTKLLMDRLRMDFAAADFKTDRRTGELAFMELNSSPMFVRFDEIAGGELCVSMARYLMRNAQ